MKGRSLRIFCDVALAGAVLRLLERGVAPHQLVLPARIAPTVLAESEPDPALSSADIAFGQPGAEGVVGASRLKWLHLSSAGYTRYDTPQFRNVAVTRKLAVTNSSSVYAQPCAEHVLAFMLARARRLPDALRAGSIRGDSKKWLALRASARLLRSQNVVLLGFGSIARNLAALLKPFQMQISALRKRRRGDESIRVITLRQLPGALAKADHVVNLLPANPGSVGFMSAARFAAMKKGSVFYNIGRGATVDQSALLAALRSGHLAEAWLDVTEPEPLPANHPLRRVPNCFITPHIAGGHENESETLVRHFLRNFRRFLRGGALLDRIM